MVGEAVPRMISPQWGECSVRVGWSLGRLVVSSFRRFVRKPETGNRKPETERLAAGFDHRILAP